MPKKNGTIVDLFCGCGGFSLGAELAGFRSISAVDIDPILQSGYRRNFPGTKVVQGSVSDIDKSAWRQFIGNVRPDGVIGGPPCQGFSWIGKRQKNDPRNSLLHKFYGHVAILKPKFFIMENVGGLLDEENIDVLRSAIALVDNRYTVLEPFIVNAAHYGAATNRLRVVVFGYDPNEIDPVTIDYLRPKPPAEFLTVREAIADLPEPVTENADEIDFGWAEYPTRAISKLSKYANRMRKKPRSGLGWSDGVQLHQQGFVSGFLKTKHSKEVAQRYRTTLGGKTDKKTKSYRLEWDGQCPTLRAGTGPDKGSFQAVRPLHPSKGRVITVREAARLQGFPDWFVFHQTKWHSFRMIGNSVSPIVAQGLMKRIARKMDMTLA